MLVSMGFPENRAIAALLLHSNIDRAAEYLFSTINEQPEVED